MFNGDSAQVFWITGLSGSGKSTIAEMLRCWLAERGIHAVMLDGDAIRDLVLDGGGHDRNSRLRIARFNARLCRFLGGQGLTVICPTISLFHEVQAWNREHIPGYVEILLDVPMQELHRRDPKGIYARAKSGELQDVVGLDIRAEYPIAPDFVLQHYEGVTVEQSFEALASWMNEPAAGQPH